MKTRAIYYNIPLFFLSLFMGFKAGSLIFPGSLDPATAPDGELSQPFVTLPNGQRSLLTVVVDDITSKTPQLESIWMVMYLPQDERLTLMPVYPSMIPSQTDSGAALQESFKLNNQGKVVKLHPQFLKQLGAMDLWWSGYVIVDRFAVNQLSGVPAATPAAHNFIGKASETSQDFSTNVFAQFNNYQIICRSIMVGWNEETPHLSPVLMELLSEHIMVSFDESQLFTELHIIEGYGRDLVCDSPAITSLFLVRR